MLATRQGTQTDAENAKKKAILEVKNAERKHFQMLSFRLKRNVIFPDDIYFRSFCSYHVSNDRLLKINADLLIS